jgi:hypothetical protein
LNHRRLETLRVEKFAIISRSRARLAREAIEFSASSTLAAAEELELHARLVENAKPQGHAVKDGGVRHFIFGL